MYWDTSSLTEQIPDLTVRVKVRRGFLKNEWVDVKSYYVSEKECIIKTDEVFNTSDSVTLSLLLDIEPSNVVIDSVTTTVEKQKKECSCFYYLLNFNDQSIKSSTSIHSPLLRLTDLIKRKEQITAKCVSLAQFST